MKKNIKFADLKILKHEIFWYISYNYYSNNGFRNILILGGEHVCYLTLTEETFIQNYFILTNL